MTADQMFLTLLLNLECVVKKEEPESKPHNLYKMLERVTEDYLNDHPEKFSDWWWTMRRQCDTVLASLAPQVGEASPSVERPR